MKYLGMHKVTPQVRTAAVDYVDSLPTKANFLRPSHSGTGVHLSCGVQQDLDWVALIELGFKLGYKVISGSVIQLGTILNILRAAPNVPGPQNSVVSEFLANFQYFRRSSDCCRYLCIICRRISNQSR